MWTPQRILLAILAAVTVVYVVAWVWFARSARPHPTPNDRSHTLFHAAISFVFTFLDTLGIGNFAPTTAAFKFRGSVPDERIPGTLNVGYAITTIAEALIFIAAIEVEFQTLVLMIAASVAGAWLGAGLVSHWSRRTIQLGMGGALIVAAGLMVLRQLEIGPSGGSAHSLQGTWLAVGLVGNFVLGALMTLGIGLYGPCLILVSLLGMDPRAAFPIMMGSCSFLMPVGGLRFIREGSYCVRTAVVLTLSGLPAVLIAAYLVREMSLEYIRWLVVAAVLSAAAMMLHSAWIESRTSAARAGDSTDV